MIENIRTVARDRVGRLAPSSLANEPPNVELPPVEAYGDHQAAGSEPKNNSGPPAENIREQAGIKSMAEIMQTKYPEPRWAIPGLLPEGLTLLAGAPKGKKSWFALGVGIAIATGGKALGRIAVERGRVLYLALEDRERRLQSRARLILQNDRNGPQLLDIATRWKRLDDGGLTSLRKYLSQHTDTRLVIIDTLAIVRPREKRGQPQYDADYEAIRLLKAVADEFSVSMLVITHTRKQEADDFMDVVTGTHGISGAADGGLVLKRPRCSDRAILSITGRDIEEERESVLEWHQQTCTWHLTDERAADTKLTPERLKIVGILRESPTPLSSKQLAAVIHEHEIGDKDDPAWKAARSLLGKMVRDGTIEQLDNKSYVLPEFAHKAGGRCFECNGSGGVWMDEHDSDDKNAVAPIAPVAPVAPVAPIAPVALIAPVAPVAPNENDCDEGGIAVAIDNQVGATGLSVAPNNQAGEESATGATGATLGAVAPSIDVSNCRQREIPRGATGATGATAISVAPPAAEEPPDFGASDDGYWMGAIPDSGVPTASFASVVVAAAAAGTVSLARPPCVECAEFRSESAGCRHSRGVIPDLSKPPCQGAHFRPKEIRS